MAEKDQIVTAFNSPQIKLTQPTKKDPNKVAETIGDFRQINPYQPQEIKPQYEKPQLEAVPGLAVNPEIKKQREAFLQQQRDVASRQIRGLQQETEGAIARKFASIGQKGSGAEIGAMLKGQEMVSGQRQQIEAGLAGQALQAQESDLNMAVQMREAALGRRFNAQQAADARNLAREQAAIDAGMKQTMFMSEQEAKLAELELARRQFLVDQLTTEFNKKIAASEAGMPISSIESSVTGNVTQEVLSAITEFTKWAEEQRRIKQEQQSANDLGGM